MPHVIQPGGGGGKMRVRYPAAASKRMMAEGKTLRVGDRRKALDEMRQHIASNLGDCVGLSKK